MMFRGKKTQTLLRAFTPCAIPTWLIRSAD